MSVSLCSQILSHQHTSRNLYPSIVTFSGLESNPNRPSLSTQRTSTTSTSSSSSPSSTAGDWLISTQMGTTQAQFNDLLTLLSKLGLTPYNILSSPALGFQQLIVGMNSSVASKIQKYKIVTFPSNYRRNPTKQL